MTRQVSRSPLLAAAVASVAALAIVRALPTGAGHIHMADAEASAAERPGTVIRPVSCQELPDIPGKSITTAVVDFPPLASSPPHRHPGTVTAFVLKATLRSRLAGGPAETFGLGQTWFEPPGALHLLSENPSASDAAELLAVFIADTGCGPLVIPEPPP